MSIKTLLPNRSKARSEKRFPNITLTELKGWELNCENLPTGWQKRSTTPTRSLSNNAALNKRHAPKTYIEGDAVKILRLFFSFYGRTKRSMYWVGMGVVYAMFFLATMVWSNFQ